jgi:hypothetical protein
MSKSGWGLLVSAFFALIGIVAPVPDRWRMGIFGFALIGLIISCFGWIYTHWRQRQSEQNVRQWIDKLRLTRRVTTNDKLYFGFLVEIPPRFKVFIERYKTHRDDIALTSKFRLSDKQRDAFEKMSNGEKMSVYQEIRIECGRLKIYHHMHPDLKVLFIRKQIPIADLNETRLLDTLNEVRCAADVVMDTMDRLIKLPS